MSEHEATVRNDEIEIKTDSGDGPETTSTISEPAKLLRIGYMLRALQQEVREDHVDGTSLDRLRRVHQTATKQIDDALSGALKDELAAFSLPFEQDPPTEAEIRVAQAQLLGWLEGLLQGIQAAIASQQQEALSQLAQMRQGGPGRPQQAQQRPGGGPGQYL